MEDRILPEVCMWKAGEVVFSRGDFEARRNSDLKRSQLLEISGVGTEKENLESEFFEAWGRF